MSPNETLWRGSLVLDQSDVENERKCVEIKVTISAHEESINSPSVFNWGSNTTSVHLKRYPRSALRKKDENGEELDLEKHLKVYVSLDEEREDMNLLSYLGYVQGQGKYIGYLKPAREDLAAVLLLVTQLSSQIKLVGHCLDSPACSLLLENIDSVSDMAEETVFVQCVPDLKAEYEEDDQYHEEDTLTNDEDIFKIETSDQTTHSIGENLLVLKYNCNLCDFQTARKRYLAEHRKSDHEGNKYECDQCDYQTSHKGHLSRHQKSKHEGIKFECSKCDYQATQMGHLIRHQMSKHEAIKYKCNYCDYEAKKMSYVENHQEAKHATKKHKCDQCDHQATTKGNLVLHQKYRHEGIRYECNECNYKAKQKSNLLRHKSANHKEIKYECKQ